MVVGGTSGIGRGIALEAAHKGAKVTVVGRKQQPEDSSVANLSFVKADLSSMQTAKQIGETILADDVKSLDVVVFTIGVIAKKIREETPEGLEMGLAISYLSRLVILKYLSPRLKEKARIFIMGFPGSNGPYKLDDLNSEKSYEGMFGFSDFNAIVSNEALVIDLAVTETSNQILYFGLNPGLIKTGIRDTVYQHGFIYKLLGYLVDLLFAASPESYASKIVPLLFASELDTHNGSFFNSKAQPIVGSKFFSEQDDLAHKFVTTTEDLVRTKTGIDLP